jgi:hypothetical protein
MSWGHCISLHEMIISITRPYIIFLVLLLHQNDLFWEDILCDIIALFGITFLYTYYVSSVNAPSLLFRYRFFLYIVLIMVLLVLVRYDATKNQMVTDLSQQRRILKRRYVSDMNTPSFCKPSYVFEIYYVHLWTVQILPGGEG